MINKMREMSLLYFPFGFPEGLAPVVISFDSVIVVHENLLPRTIRLHSIREFLGK